MVTYGATQEIQGRHWLETAKRCGFGDMQEVIHEVIAQTPKAIERVRSSIPPDFPASIADSIIEGVHVQTEQLKSQMARS